MRDNQKKSTELMLQHEGGYVNHPEDPGGATNKGVIQRVYDAYRRNKGLATRSVREITDTEVFEIYDQQYWDAIKADRLPAGVDYAVFDYAVNSGTVRAIKDLQRTVGAPVDGGIGDVTIAAVNAACAVDEEKLIRDYCNRRMGFLRSLRTFKTFGKGWSRRVMGERDGFQTGDHGVIDLAIMMARHDLTYPLPEVQMAAGKALETDIKQTQTKGGVGTIIAASGLSGQTVMSAADQVKPHMTDGPLALAATILFVVLILTGVGLMAWTTYQKLQEKTA